MAYRTDTALAPYCKQLMPAIFILVIVTLKTVTSHYLTIFTYLGPNSQLWLNKGGSPKVRHLVANARSLADDVVVELDLY